MGVFQEYALLAVLAIIGAAITAVYILRLIAKAFLGPVNPEWANIEDANPVELASSSMLAVVIVFIGIWPMPIMNVINSGVDELLIRFLAI